MQFGSFQPAFRVASHLLLVFALGCDDQDPELVTAPPNGTRPATQSSTPSTDAGRAPPTLVPNEVPADLPPLSCGGLLGSSTCDPVTAWPCRIEAGEVCELSQLAGAFRCFQVPTAMPFCGPCDRTTVFCGPGTTCGDVTCERYCCQDSDCERGSCLRGIYGDRGVGAVGICGEESAAACGSPVGAVIAERLAEIADAGASTP